MCRWMKIGIQWNTLQAVYCPSRDSGQCVENHGAIDQMPEKLRVGKTKIEEQKCHFYDPVHPDIIYLFNEEGLESLVSTGQDG